MTPQQHKSCSAFQVRTGKFDSILCKHEALMLIIN